MDWGWRWREKPPLNLEFSFWERKAERHERERSLSSFGGACYSGSLAIHFHCPLIVYCVETLNNQQKVWPDAICVFLAPGLGLWQFLLQFLQFADTANGNCLLDYLYDWLGMCLVVYLDFMVGEAELWNTSSHNKASNCMNFTVTDSTSLGFRRDHSADWAVCMHISNNLINYCLLSLRLIYCMRLL